MTGKRKHAGRNGNGAGPETDAETLPAGVFINSAGKQFEIQAISAWGMETLPIELEAEWRRADRPKPAKPTYTVTTVGGTKEEHAHDETTLETDEEKAAWAHWEKENAAWEKELRERMLRNILMDGVLVQPFDEQWIARERFMGRHVPEDPLELEYYWKKTQVIRSAADGQRLMSAVLALTGVTEEAIRIAEDSFRDPVGQPDGPQTVGPAD